MNSTGNLGGMNEQKMLKCKNAIQELPHESEAIRKFYKMTETFV
jgi:hypothetical protein